MAKKKSTLLWENSADWSFDTIQRTYDEIEKIGVDEFKLNIYQNQLEIVSSEQMLDAYTSVGMPMMYNHWSFGKHFSREKDKYKYGYQGLAYELVINSSPCINYLMEDNTMTMQALVMAHASMGHNFFFKNNYLFKTWTDADSIIDYLIFAKNYIAKLEVTEGKLRVEKFLDSCHALQNYGVNQYKHPRKLSLLKEREKQKEREDYEQSRVNEFYRLLPEKENGVDKDKVDWKPEQALFPEENILYFCEKYSPNLKPWQRECIRIVRKIAQYFYPQTMTQVANEGTATYFHYTIFNRLYEKGMVSDGSIVEFLKSHSNVIAQPNWNDKYFTGLNPYKIGFEIFRDIERICKNPTDEDRRYNKDIIGENHIEVIKNIAENYRDESLILQFLSNKLIRDLKLFTVIDEKDEDFYLVDTIQNEQGYDHIRRNLAAQYERQNRIPKIEIVDANLKERMLCLQYDGYDGRCLSDPVDVLGHVRVLWGENPVVLYDSKFEPIAAILE